MRDSAPSDDPTFASPAAGFGQHALLDTALAARAVGYAELDAPAHVLEIGPGTGVLTRALLDAGHRVTAIELDRRLEPRLDALAAHQGRDRLELVWGDARIVPWPRVDAVVANLPYGPALPIVFRILERGIPISVLMLQARLAERLAADPGEARYGGVTVRARRSSSAKLLEPVSAEQFDPPPAVDSALMRLRSVEPRFPLPPAPESEPSDPADPARGDRPSDRGGAAERDAQPERGSAGANHAEGGASEPPEDREEARREAAETFWRDLLDTLFLHRDATLRAALASAGAPVRDVIRALDRGARQRLPDRDVASISPNDFGRIAWAAAAVGWRPAPVSDRAKRTAQRS